MLRMRRIVLTLATLSLPVAGWLLGGAEAQAQGWDSGYGGGYGGRVIDPGRPGGRVYIDPGRPGGRLIPAYDPGYPGGPVFILPGDTHYRRGHHHRHNGRYCYDRHCHLYGGYRRY